MFAFYSDGTEKTPISKGNGATLAYRIYYLLARWCVKITAEYQLKKVFIRIDDSKANLRTLSSIGFLGGGIQLGLLY